MSTPHITDNRQKSYSIPERIEQHKAIVQLYKLNNYQVIEIPLKFNDAWNSVSFRLATIREVLGI